jgi:hypothetical protein
MSHHEPKRRLLREVLVNESEQLPSAIYTCWTIGLVAVSLALVVLGGMNPLGF